MRYWSAVLRAEARMRFAVTDTRISGPKGPMEARKENMWILVRVASLKAAWCVAWKRIGVFPDFCDTGWWVELMWGSHHKSAISTFLLLETARVVEKSRIKVVVTTVAPLIIDSNKNVRSCVRNSIQELRELEARFQKPEGSQSLKGRLRAQQPPVGEMVTLPA